MMWSASILTLNQNPDGSLSGNWWFMWSRGSRFVSGAGDLAMVMEPRGFLREWVPFLASCFIDWLKGIKRTERDWLWRKGLFLTMMWLMMQEDMAGVNYYVKVGKGSDQVSSSYYSIVWGSWKSREQLIHGAWSWMRVEKILSAIMILHFKVISKKFESDIERDWMGVLISFIIRSFCGCASFPPSFLYDVDP